MSIVSTDIKIYGAANIAEDDVSIHGGAIDTTVKYVFDDSTLTNTLNDKVSVSGSLADDTTQVITITGRNTGGSIISENINVNGLTSVDGNSTFERLLKISIDAVHNGSINILKQTGGTLISSIESGVLSVRRPFYNVSSDVTDGESRDFYEKLFIKNTNTVNSLLNATIAESGDPTGYITFDLEDAVNDNNSVASRLNTAPTNMLGTFTSATKNVPGTDLPAGSGIGIWLKMTLPAGAVAGKSTYTIGAAGSTT
jgi:hypothetical protein